MAVSIRNIGSNTELDRVLNENFTTPLRTGYVEVGEDNVCLPIYFRDYEEKIRRFQVRDDDVFLFGLAKTGTTWCHEMIWLIANNLDYISAKQHMLQRCPMLEMSILYDFNIMKLDELVGEHPFSHLENLKSPRCIKSHLHWSLLPEEIRNGSKQPKIIAIFRNPKDTCVSHYHQARAAAGYKGTFKEFTRLYLAGRVPYGPYWKHVLSVWEQRKRPNILLVKYEDMKADLPSTIRKMANFLDKSFTDVEIETLAEHLSLRSMKKNPAVNMKDIHDQFDEKYNLAVAKNEFVRDGTVGGHGSLMSSEISAEFDAWAAENLTGTDCTLY